MTITLINNFFEAVVSAHCRRAFAVAGKSAQGGSALQGTLHLLLADCSAAIIADDELNDNVLSISSYVRTLSRQANVSEARSTQDHRRTPCSDYRCWQVDCRGARTQKTGKIAGNTPHVDPFFTKGRTIDQARALLRFEEVFS